MIANSPLTYKIANRPAEIEQIHRLNYETFVEEIPQHPANPERRLIDQFHPENTYLIALHGEMLVGMIAARGTRPFSLDYKLENLDRYLPAHTSICEFRLLAVRPEWRGGQVLLGLMELLNRYCLEHGHDLGIMSGTTRQQKLYRHLGFEPFGPLVGKGDVRFQPMFLTVRAADAQSRPLLDLQTHRRQAPSPANFLPGPVAVSPAVKAAFALDPISHRSDEFRSLVQRVKERLLLLTHASQMEIMSGSGTTANDAMAAQLSLINGYGLIVTNGEFGERLIDHASRFNLKFDTGRHGWGEPLRYDAIDRTAKRDRPQWIWMVHGETSTGTLNDLARMKAIARGAGARLVVDCIGSLGTVPLDLTGVFLASGTSGKGLASYAGLGMVLLDHSPRTGDRIPRSLDLGYYTQQQGIPFTMFTNHVAALDRALDRIEAPDHYRELAARAERVRSVIAELGLATVTPAEHASPAVFTIALPAHKDAGALGEALAANGIFVNYESAYLRDRNWFQVCLMGDVSDSDIERLVDQLRES